MKKETKKKVVDDGKHLKKKITPQDRQEQEALFAKADEISPVNKRIEKAEIVQLYDGTFVNIDEYVADNYAEKTTHYFKPFYNSIADLLGENRDIMEPFRKPRIVAVLKRKLIYGRFPNAVQRKIYKRNPYIGYCTRKYWNYQTLTKKGDLSVREFINDFQTEAERVFANGGNVKLFIVEYSRKYGLPIQLEMFEI